MIRLAIAIVILTAAIVVIRRKQRRTSGGDGLRVASRTGISRGVMAAVIEVEQRRFLVTITATSTTLVAELGPTGQPLTTPGRDDVADPSVSAPPALPIRPAGPAPVAAPVVAPVAAAVDVAAVPAEPATAPAAGTLLDRLRARTVRAYDPQLVAQLRAER
jgi:hypothetical protein